MPVPAEPFMRPAPPEGSPSAPCPPGWTSERAGLWDGQHQEVVFNPRRHDVLIVRGGLSTNVESTLPSIGWTQARSTDGARMWVRDRLAMTRAALDRLEQRPRVARELGRSF